MSDNKQLEQQLWNIANTLRGKMDADEFRDYILGFIFYKYLSEKMRLLADKLLSEDNIKYIDINENTSDGKELLDAIRDDAIDSYWGEQKLQAFNKLCKEEKLSENKIQAVIEEYLFANQITSINRKIDDALLERETYVKRKKTVKRVIEKIMSFIETFVDELAA